MPGEFEPKPLPAVCRALATPQVIEAIVLKLPPDAVASWAASCRRLHGLLKVNLAFSQLQACAAPAASMESVTSLHLNAHDFHGSPTHACTTLCSLLRSLSSIRHLSMKLPDVPQSDVLAVLHAANHLTALTHLAFEHANLTTVSPAALAQWLQRLPRLRHLSLADAMMTVEGARTLVSATHANRLLTALDLSNHTLPGSFLSSVVSACNPHLQLLRYTHRPALRDWGRKSWPWYVRAWAASVPHADSAAVHTASTQAVAHLHDANIMLSELECPRWLQHDLGLELLRMTTLRALHLSVEQRAPFIMPQGELTCSVGASEALKAIGALTRLTALTLDDSIYISCQTPELESALAQLTRLEYVSLGIGGVVLPPPHVEDHPVHFIHPSLTSLTHVELRGGLYSDGVAETYFHIASVLRALSALQFLQIRVWPEHLPVVGALVRLTQLRLWLPGPGDDEGTAELLEAALERLTALVHLDLRLDEDLYYCRANVLPALANGCVTSLALKGLDVDVDMWREEGAACAPTTLRHLNLVDYDWRAATRTLALLRHVSQLTSLVAHLVENDDDEDDDVDVDEADDEDDDEDDSDSEFEQPLVGETLARLQMLRALTLTVNDHSHTKDAAHALQHLTRLTHLGLFFPLCVHRDGDVCDLLTAALWRMRLLKDLQVDGFVASGDSVATGVAGHVQLTSLVLANMTLTATAMHASAQTLSCLQKLVMNCMDYQRGRDTGAAGAGAAEGSNWRWLSCLSGLTELRVKHRFTGTDVECCTRVLPALQQLQLLTLSMHHSEAWPEAGFGELSQAIESMTQLLFVDMKDRFHMRRPSGLVCARDRLESRMPTWFFMDI